MLELSGLFALGLGSAGRQMVLCVIFLVPDGRRLKSAV